MNHPETASKKKKKKGKRVKQAVIIQSTSTNNQTQSFIYTKIKLEWIKKKPPKKAHNHCMSVILLPPSPLFSGSMASRISPEPAILIGPMYETKASQMQSNAMISLPAFLSTYHGHIFWDIRSSPWTKYSVPSSLSCTLLRSRACPCMYQAFKHESGSSTSHDQECHPTTVK